MSAFTSHSHARSEAGPALGSGLIRFATAALAEWRAIGAARTLRSLDDRSLRDIGLSRAKIGHAVRFGRD